MSDHTRLLKLTARAAFVLVALAPAHVPAQSSQAARDARRTDMIMRQRALQEVEKLKDRKPAKAPDTRPAYKDVAEEFKQLQLVNYSLAGVADPKVALDYARVR